MLRHPRVDFLGFLQDGAAEGQVSEEQQKREEEEQRSSRKISQAFLIRFHDKGLGLGAHAIIDPMVDAFRVCPPTPLLLRKAHRLQRGA